MGYSGLKERLQHEKDAKRIRELEKQIANEKKIAAQAARDEGHVTIEKTSKKLKKQLIFSWTCFIIGLCIFPLSEIASGVTMLVGLFLVAFTKFAIWYNHG